ncbi:choline BCCT transporter BetT [Solicola gregarius]|uniref:Choline BCCT transporter BetT n=1 Tax=Solicola gregarius TaxID=2908642 RepID=A0AA46TFI3_9ACTN|nr:choline BCCT transporter BetT [Solicola gregarius]UYM03919.1 choline BCCT transporter BetT [Solicola gregarius]
MSVTERAEVTREPDEPEVRPNWPVLVGSSICIIAIALWAIIDPESAAVRLGDLLTWVTESFGWFYVLIATVFVVFVVLLAFSRYGKVKLGPEHSTPDFGMFSWASMLFAAGIGTDIMFFAVSEPVTQYLAPPTAEPESVDAAREATVWTLFHYGITGWGMYALMGIALAYFAFRMNLPLSIRSAVYPIFGKRIYGPLGDGIDLAAVIATIFGIAVSLGIGVAQINYGLDELFGIEQGKAAQIGLVVVAVVAASASAVSGVDKGIKFLSQLNVILALGLAFFIVVTGRTQFLLNALVENTGDFVSKFPGMTMETFAQDPQPEWMSLWTLFFWAWWIAWASFVGMFLARISRGRTIRQFVTGTMIIPFTYILMWVSIYGNAALDRVRGGDADFGAATAADPASGLWELLRDYPWFPFIAGVAIIVGLLFYVTSADSGALVMGNLTTFRRTPRSDAPPWLRIFWASITGLLTIAMLGVGDNGIIALQNATVVMGLPFAFVMVLLMFGLYKALRVEGHREDSRAAILPAQLSGRVHHDGAPGSKVGRFWQERLRRAMTFADTAEVSTFLSDTALPAMREVREELAEHGVEATCHTAGDSESPTHVELEVELSADDQTFRYRLVPLQAELPAYRTNGDGERTYSRVEVHLGEGGQGYDVMGYSHMQLIDDMLDQYERHLEFLRLGQ